MLRRMMEFETAIKLLREVLADEAEFHGIKVNIDKSDMALTLSQLSDLTVSLVKSEDSKELVNSSKSDKAGERVKKLKHNPYMAIGVTLKKLGIMHSGKRDFETAHAIFGESEKFIRIACNGDSEHVKIAKLNGFIGDACIRERTKKSLQRAMGVYENANRIYGRTVGKDTFLFLHSLSDVGDVYLEQKETKKA